MANIQPSSTKTGRDHDVSDFVFEVLDEAFSVYLVLTSVKDDGLITDLIQLFKQVISLNLFVYKDKHTSFVLPLSQKFDQSPEFVFVLEHFYDLVYVARCLSTVSNYYLYRMYKDCPRQVFNRPWEGGAKHDRLFIGSTFLKHNFYLRLEAHIQNSISFVQHHITYSFQVCDLAVGESQDISHSARSAHNNLSASLQHRQLVLDIDSAVNCDYGKSTFPSKSFCFFLNLQDEFSSWCNNQPNRTISITQWPLISDMSKHR